MEQSGQHRIRLREIEAKSCWRATRSFSSLNSEFPRGDLKLGGDVALAGRRI